MISDSVPKRLVYIKPSELPYLTHVPIDGRSVVISAYYDLDARQFYAYSAQPENQIVVLPIVDLVDGAYIAKASADGTRDILLPFSEAIVQYFSFGDAYLALEDAEEDLLNSLASLHKYFVLLDYANSEKQFMYATLVRTEIEYAFGNHRAFYDCLHKIVWVLHKHYRPESPSLPDSFAKMVEHKTEEDLIRKFLFPPPLARFYTGRRDTFLKLRDMRDNIFHHGHTPGSIYHLPEGFAVGIDDQFSRSLGSFNLWPDHLLRSHRLGSILALLEFLSRDISYAMQELGEALLSCFPVPPQPLAANHHVYLRTSLSRHLSLLRRYRDEHWFNPKMILETVSAPGELSKAHTP